MSFLYLKNKTDPKYSEPHTATIHEDVFTAKSKSEEKKLENSKNLIIGEEVKITGSINANNEVTLQGTIEGDIECNNLTIKKSGNIKGKIITESMIVEGKVEGETNVNALLNIKSDGQVIGKIFYNEIIIDKGGKIDGEINQREKDNKQEIFKDLKSLSWKL